MFDNYNSADFKSAIETDENAVILDVRTQEEVAEGMIPNAKHIDIFRPDFTAKVLDLDKSKNYYVYCRSGGRSANACQAMSQMGFSKLVNLSGGVMAWQGELV